MSSIESDSEVKENATPTSPIRTPPPSPAFLFDLPLGTESTGDPRLQELTDLLQGTIFSETLHNNQFPDLVTSSPWFSGGIMSTYSSPGGNGCSSGSSSGGHYYRGNGPTALRDHSTSTSGSSSEGSPPLLHSPTIYPQGVIGHSYLGQQSNGLTNNGGMACGVQRTNSLPFELNGREVAPGMQGTMNHDTNLPYNESPYAGPVSHSSSIGNNGRIPPSIRLAMGLNEGMRRKQKVKYNFCVFCKNNGEDEKVYMDHTLKHDNGTIRCPILYNYECPLCGATGPVSHTIRYCPSSKGRQQFEEVASITQLKQMRSSTGRLRNNNNSAATFQVVGSPPSLQSPPSVAAARQFYNSQQQVAVCNTLAQGQPNHFSRPVLGQGQRNRDSSLIGPNSAWTGSATQPCITPMYGEYINNQNRQRCYENLYQTAPKACSGPYQSQHLSSLQVPSQAQ